MQNSKVEEPSKSKPHNLKSSQASHPSQSGNAKTSDKTSRKEKKKQYGQEQARKDSITATGGNATNKSGGESNGGARKDLNQVTCYNCNEYENYSKNCPEPRKDASSEN